MKLIELHVTGGDATLFNPAWIVSIKRAPSGGRARTRLTVGLTFAGHGLIEFDVDEPRDEVVARWKEAMGHD